MAVEQNEIVEGSKKGRHRKKQLYSSIMQQMEFYFSDSNLTKDRFLSQLISRDPYVNLSVFMSFNKIRKLNCTIEDICKAISKSELIELSEDKEKIRRKTEIKQKENVDACTIYIENVKADATHDSLKQVFSDFGNVVYVSIPKYRQSRLNKGFAFVEFETEDEAKNALEYFENIDCKMPSGLPPEQLKSIQTHEENVPETQSVQTDVLNDNGKGEIPDQIDKNLKKMETDEESLSRTDIADCPNPKRKGRKGSESDMSHKKRKESESIHDDSIEGSLKASDSDTEFHKSKKKKHRDKFHGDTDKGKKKRKMSEQDTETNKRSKVVGNDDEKTEKTNEKDSEVVEGENKKKKKNKKDKRKAFIREMGLKILSKKEWKVMRNRYLDQQKKNMREFKLHLYKQKMNQRYIEKGKACNESPHEQENRNTDVVEPKLDFVPGVIVKMNLPDTEADPKRIKNDIKAISEDVKYVDVIRKLEGKEVFIRFGTREAAREFCSADYATEKNVLEGAEEESYWEKIQSDKNTKLKKSAKKVRGRDKLLKKAEKANTQHLRFDEAE